MPAEVKVLDASALGAVVFNEPAASQVVGELTDCDMASPALLWYEMASIALKKIKASPSGKDQMVQALSFAYQLDVKTVEVNPTEVVQLAFETGLSTYDASYLWLANTLSASLVTLDRSLHEAFLEQKANW